ncbi:MAG: hypothetical protein ACW991_02870 [Candidatus Hodarchaeales archaeon]|jgi:hypothetical protein
MSYNDTVTTIALTIDEFLRKIDERVGDLNFVYDEALTIETAIAKYRSEAEQRGEVGPTIPLFAFRRTILRYFEHGIGRRTATVQSKQKRTTGDTTKSIIFKSLYGEFDIPFMYIEHDMFKSEVFEIQYMAEHGISNVKDITINIPGLGVHTYETVFTPLEERVANVEGVYYKGINGMATIRGWYHVLRGDSPHITEINAKIQSYLEKVFATIQHTG